VDNVLIKFTPWELRVPALGEVRMISLVRGEDAVNLGEPTAAAAAAETKSIKSTPNKAQFIIFMADEGTKIAEYNE
jgi:hypothetical protein